MKLYMQGHRFQYECENLIRVFLPGEKVECAFFIPGEVDLEGDFCLTVLENGRVTVQTVLNGNAATFCEDITEGVSKKEQERIFGKGIYRTFSALLGKTPAWGLLTGIRPAKLLHSMRAEGKSDIFCKKVFIEDYLVHEEKFELCRKVADKEAPILAASTDRSYSLYVSIPFCPSRCRYCSFVSHSTEKAGKLIPEYLQKLSQELVHTAEMVNSLGLRLETIYIGGGTPTVLAPEQLFELLNTIRRLFPDSFGKEFTVEAGRPDTITPEKLAVLRQSGVTRISINPQTMNDEVLERIGRKHSSAQIKEAFAMAKEAGFDNINADLIAGLPGDSPASFEDTLSQLVNLDPDSITVHTLSLKRASDFYEKNSPENHEALSFATIQTKAAQQILPLMGYHPYYLYRQKNTIGALENVGFAKEGREGRYNVYIMNEAHTILACGAGGVTKLVCPVSGRIERLASRKYPYEYISDFENILKERRGIAQFYEEFGKRK